MVAVGDGRGGGAGGGAAAAAALAEERAAASEGGREGRKGARQAGWRARGSVTEAIEGGEIPAAVALCCSAGFWRDRPSSRPRRSGHRRCLCWRLGAGDWGGRKGGRCGGFLAVSLSLPFCLLGGLLPASP